MYKRNKKQNEKVNPTEKSVAISIYYPDDLYYGRITMKTSNGMIYEEDAKEEVERRLPFFKNKKYTISIG